MHNYVLSAIPGDSVLMNSHVEDLSLLCLAPPKQMLTII